MTRNHFPRPALRAIALVLFLFLAAASIAAAPQSGIDVLEERVKGLLEGYYNEHGFAGASVAFVLADGEQGAVAVGHSDVEAKVPLVPANLMLSGSIGKTYAAAVALQLVAEKKLVLDEKIGKWLGEEEWFPRLPNAHDITVRMLLKHTSGIPEHVLLPEFGKAIAAEPDRVWEPAELVAYVLDSAPRFPAGEGWSYADTNYIVLGMIIEKITGGTYYDALRTRIIEPLCLANTLPSDSRTIPGLVNGYAGERSPFRMPGRTIRDGKFVVNPQMEWTGGGLATTPGALARWAHALYRGRAFDPALMDQFLDGVPAFTGPGDKYGLGTQIFTGPLGTSYGHGGWFPGYVSLMAYYPAHELAVAIQFNTSRSAAVRTNMRAWLDALAACLAEGVDPIMGEYEGLYLRPDGSIVKGSAKVIAEGDGKHRMVLIGHCSPPVSVTMQRDSSAEEVIFGGTGDQSSWKAAIDKGQCTVATDDPMGSFVLVKSDRCSPTAGLAPPEGAVVLLPFEEGKPTTLKAWANKNWIVLDDGSVMVHRGHNRTLDHHRSGLFHIEFKTPFEPTRRGQGRGNSGVYFGSRYEIQILDSFGLVPGMGDCGSIYGVAITGENASLPPCEWQTYDVIYRAPKQKDDGTFEFARMTVFHNGVKIHEDQPVPRPTTAAPEKNNAETGPLYFQDHGNPVCYRNIWYLELPE